MVLRGEVVVGWVAKVVRRMSPFAGLSVGGGSVSLPTRSVGDGLGRAGNGRSGSLRDDNKRTGKNYGNGNGGGLFRRAAKGFEGRC